MDYQYTTDDEFPKDERDLCDRVGAEGDDCYCSVCCRRDETEFARRTTRDYWLDRVLEVTTQAWEQHPDSDWDEAVIALQAAIGDLRGNATPEEDREL